jgi:hypothetical protein
VARKVDKPQEIKMGESVFSYEFIRQTLAGMDKFEHRRLQYGLLAATQAVREVRKLHSYEAAERTEIDHTKYGLWLFPNKRWSEPRFFHVGHSVDHYTGVIRGFTTTLAPSSRDIVRLCRRSVLPKNLWLPESAKHLAAHWDVFGLEDLIALDNAVYQTMEQIILMLITWGTIVLRIPPARGDLKGTVERRHWTSETQFISGLPGYVPSPFKLNSQYYERLKAQARLRAKYDVVEFTEQYAQYVVETNHASHPTLKKPRIELWRLSQERAPLIVPTGELQLKATFALTYEPTLTRQGVQVERVHFNSAELHDLYRTYTGPVFFKLDPDDVRDGLVLAPHVDTPIKARLVEFESVAPMTLEALQYVLAPFQGEPDEALARALPTVFPERLEELREGRGDSAVESTFRAAEAATQTAQQDARAVADGDSSVASKKDKADPFAGLRDTFDF